MRCLPSRNFRARGTSVAGTLIRSPIPGDLAMAYKLPALMLALAACGTVSNNDPSESVADDQPTTDPSDPRDEGTAFRYFMADKDGAAQTQFASASDAYLNA